MKDTQDMNKDYVPFIIKPEKKPTSFFVVTTIVLLVIMAVTALVWYARPLQVVETVTETEEVAVVTEDAGNPFMLKCQSNILLTESLWSCWENQRCNLSDSEITMMYITYKGSVIMCKRAYMFEMFQKVNVSEFLEKKNGSPPEAQTRND